MNLVFKYDAVGDVLVVSDSKCPPAHLLDIVDGVNMERFYIDRFTKKCVKRRIPGFASKYLVNPETRPYSSYT
jgi:hypothetical protein